MSKKILITGGAGFIGSALIRYLISKTNHVILNIDKLTYAGNIDSLKKIKNHKRYSFKKIDICNKTSIKKILLYFQPDIVFHLAAETHVDRSIDDPKQFIQTNIFGTYTLLNETKNYWLSLKNKKKKNFIFHHISTDEVYGDIKKNFFASEKYPYIPSSPYSASKASSDHLVRAWYRTYKLPIIITNSSNNYGPYQFPEKLIPFMIINALERKQLPIYGDGTNVRDWLYVEDHAKAILKVALKGKRGETYNIGGHNNLRNLDIVKIICKTLNELKPLSTTYLKKYEKLITYVADRPGHDKRYALNTSKIKKELNWIPDETFETGIKKTIKWYLENKAWYEKIKKKYYSKRQGLIKL